MYRNSWQRFLASIIDGILLYLPILIVWMNVQDETFKLYFFNLYNLVPITYFVFCNYYCGQTLGKSVMNIKVVNYSTEENISFKQSVFRESPWVILSVLSTTCYLLQYFLGYDSITGFNGLLLAFASTFGTYWWFLEMITMFTNSKRRAIHDFLGGTVVVRSNS